MEKDGKFALKPRLRFPEYQDATGWEETKLKDVLTEHRLKSDGTSEVHSVSVHKGVINQKEHLGRSFAAADTTNYNLAQPYDIIYTKSPTGDFPFGVVKQNKLRHNVLVSPLYGVFRPTNKHVGYILDAYFESPSRTNNYLAPIIHKGAKNTIQIANDTFLSRGLFIPRDEGEQQKIADCLSSIAELIAAQAGKLEALKAHKTGLMQQLFPGEGETQPRVRFPEFRNAPEWEEGDAGALFANRTEEGEAGLPIYSVTMNNGMVKRSSLDRDFDDIADPAGNKKANTGDIAYNMMRMWQGALGVAVEDCMVSPAYVVLSPRQGVCSDFFGYLLKLPKYLQLLASNSQGLTKDRLRLYYKDFALIQLPFPDISEQRKIADFLSSVDKMIAAQARKLDALNNHKRGLMQQLFPSPEVVEA